MTSALPQRTDSPSDQTDGPLLRLVAPVAPVDAPVPDRDALPGSLALKTVADPLLAGAMLVVALPILAALAVGVLLTSGRPIVFRQRRVGRRGREFDLLKFRSMHAGCSAAGDWRPGEPDCAPGGVEGDDRRTGLGRFLRRSCLDELPQLINVVRGDMSLIGPRPERPEFVASFSTGVPGYYQRHRVKPGITGWAQVNGLRGQTSVRRRAEFDNYYIEHHSLVLDLRILLGTIRAVLRPVE